MNKRESKFEAFVYTENRAVAVRCAEAFAEFPVDWIMVDDSSLALEYLAKERFDFVILDLDSGGNGSLLLDVVNSGINLHSVVLAITSAPVDPSLLALCYASQVFYPVRPRNIEEELYRSVPFAERISAQERNVEAGQTCTEEQAGGSLVPVAHAPQSFRLLVRTKHVVQTWATLLGNVLGMNHSLSIAAQERVASILACIGTLWFVREITTDFAGIQFIAPPSTGPTYLTALALLLWLCAKQRRSQRKYAKASVGSHPS